MSPEKQAAQIANAQKSRGPVTDAGRARSSQSSIRHSLCSKKYFIVPEDRPEFDLYYNDLIAALAPEGAVESKLAESIIMDEWRLTRARQVENQIFCRGYMSAKPENQSISGAETWLAHAKELATLTLYEQRINRVLARNKAEFECRQAARQTSGAESGAGLLACGTPVPHPGALPTTQSQSPGAMPVSRPQPLPNPLDTNSNPPLQNSPLGSLIRVTYDSRRLRKSPQPKPRRRPPLQSLASFIRAAPHPRPQSPDPRPRTARWVRSFE